MKLTETMAACNGILHAGVVDQAALLEEAALSAVEADGVYTEDAEKFEAWLGTLSTDQLMTLADGEETEMLALVAESPLSSDNEAHVAALAFDIYAVMEDYT